MFWRIDWHQNGIWHFAGPFTAEQLTWVLNHKSFRGIKVYVYPEELGGARCGLDVPISWP